jgi:hypothetical protein
MAHHGATQVSVENDNQFHLITYLNENVFQYSFLSMPIIFIIKGHFRLGYLRKTNTGLAEIGSSGLLRGSLRLNLKDPEVIYGI